jgi:hypothetical protein
MKKNILLLALFAFVMSLPARAADYAWEAEFESPAEVSTEIDAEFQDIQISIEGAQIHILNAEGMNLEIYNLAGVRVASTKIENDDTTINLNLQHGCYILKVGKVVRKISIR